MTQTQTSEPSNITSSKNDLTSEAPPPSFETLYNVIWGPHLDVEEPGLEGVHLPGAFAEVVDHEVESSGGQEVRVRAAELLSSCGRRRKITPN